jgi:hypothetical protein
MEFSLIREIVPDSRGTWINKIFVTIDIEWSCDDVLCDTIDLAEEAGIPVSWFVTHETKVLERLRSNPLFELGIHPNFNPLLEGEKTTGGSAGEVVDRLMQVVPEAVSVRSHSLTSSSRLQEVFRSAGLTHEVNALVPETSGVRPPDPFLGWNGMTEVAYSNCDYVRCLSRSHKPVEELIVPGGASVFSFHPVHLFLNTVEISDYESTRPFHCDAGILMDHRHKTGVGNRSVFEDLARYARDLA